MRNGNFQGDELLHIRIKVLTVPMRNGNLHLLQDFLQLFVSSYRTYEEWKQNKVYKSSPCFFRSYRTYEEWKLILPTPPLHG